MPVTASTAPGADIDGTLWLMGGCAFCSLASMRVADAMLPAIGASFGAAAGGAAQAISAFALAYGLLQLVYGPLGDRFGKMRVIGSATLACTAGNLAAMVAPSLGWLVAARVLSGAAAAGIVPLTMAWIGDHVAYENRQPVLARLLSATVFGMICGQWAGGALAAYLSWRSAFAVLALGFATCGILLLRHSSRNPASSTAALGSFAAMREVMRLPWARFVLLTTLVEGALAYSALAFIPTALHGRFGLSIPLSGALAALYGVGGLVYARNARRLLARTGPSGLAALGGVSTCIAFATMAFATAWHWMPLACLLAGFGFYALHNTLQTHATQMAPQVRGTAVSLFACSLFVGQSAGIAAAAYVVDRFAVTPIFAGAAVGLLVLGLGFFAASRRQESA